MKTLYSAVLLCVSMGVQAQPLQSVDKVCGDPRRQIECRQLWLDIQAEQTRCTPCQCEANANARGAFLSPPTPRCPEQRVASADGSTWVMSAKGEMRVEKPVACSLPESHIRAVCRAMGMPFYARATCAGVSNDAGGAVIHIECSKEGALWFRAEPGVAIERPADPKQGSRGLP